LRALWEARHDLIAADLPIFALSDSTAIDATLAEIGAANG
jgi:hypothetical protein